MKGFGATTIVLAWASLTLASTGWAQELTPELVGAGTISTDANQTFPAIDPVTGDLWYSEYTRGFANQTIRVARADGSAWLAPSTAPFSGTWGDRAPRFSPDGGTLYFTSNRPPPGGTDAGDMNIWRVSREGEGWSEPQLMPAPLNSPAADIHSSATESAIWVASSREGSLGRSDFFRIDADGNAEHFGAPLNDANSQPDLWVSPDESWMILAITDHADGFGGDDLWISRRTNDEWSAPVNLGPSINSAEYEYGPWVSRDGQFLYYTSHRDGPSHVYRVPTAPLKALIGMP